MATPQCTFVHVYVVSLGQGIDTVAQVTVADTDDTTATDIAIPPPVPAVALSVTTVFLDTNEPTAHVCGRTTGIPINLCSHCAPRGLGAVRVVFTSTYGKNVHTLNGCCGMQPGNTRRWIVCPCAPQM